jgi:hypothetical protein
MRISQAFPLHNALLPLNTTLPRFRSDLLPDNFDLRITQAHGTT